ncbi:hypothetical protein SLH49_20660 [Cognatiyoonia sp. IB215446]|uniref:hypothetical protein n=1 Tax=Cognatiyoonia sp. IB215446 TaxID=3097355 RepID=UPI002A148262|nr:hypothetical protein [Cognatiyoonia sp. IB215446]MDX8350408.1 hypothetical protein [Cognatiyoonia sp. IB215446]
MSRALIDLLAMDAFAQRTGVGLNPRLRAAIEADIRFPAKRAGPIPEIAPDDLPEDIALFRQCDAAARKKA